MESWIISVFQNSVLFKQKLKLVDITVHGALPVALMNHEPERLGAADLNLLISIKKNVCEFGEMPKHF